MIMTLNLIMATLSFPIRSQTSADPSARGVPPRRRDHGLFLNSSMAMALYAVGPFYHITKDNTVYRLNISPITKT